MNDVSEDFSAYIFRVNLTALPMCQAYKMDKVLKKH